MKKTLKNKKGFTLIELLVSLAIFAIGSVMLITLIMTAMQISMRASAKAKTHLKSEEAIENSYTATGESVEGVNNENPESVKIVFSVNR